MTIPKSAATLSFILVSVALPARGAAVRPWKPAGISSPQFESHAAFDPRSGDLYFVRSSPAFEGWRILVSRCTPKGWSEPAPPSFAGDGVEADPYFSADGRSLYFISTRSLDGVKRKDLDIWRVDRGADGVWGSPTHLPAPVNSPGAEWFPRPAPDGWLYFGSNRAGGLGGNDIWRARAEAEGRWVVENLGPTVNTAGDEYEPLPAADGSRLIVMADGGLYESRKTPQGWAPRAKLGAEVNVNGTEIGAVFSPSGRSLLFSRDTKGPESGEFFVWHEGEPEAWPPECAVGQERLAEAPDAAELTRLLKEFLAGASRNDVAIHDRFWAEDLIYTRSAGRRTTKAEIMSGLRAAPATPEGPTPTYTAEDVRIQQYGDTAIVAFRLVATTPNGAVTQYLNTGVFLKRQGKWQAVGWQATRVPRPEEDARKEAAAAEAAFHQALRASDVKALESLVDASFVWTQHNGEQLTRKQLLDALAGGQLRYSKLEASTVTVSVHGDTALARGVCVLQRSAIPGATGAGDPSSFTTFYTLTFVNDGDGWKAVALMETTR